MAPSGVKSNSEKGSRPRSLSRSAARMFGGVPTRVIVPPRIAPKASGMKRRDGASAGLAGDARHRRQEHGHRGDIVHEGGEDSRDEHDGDGEQDLAAADQPVHAAPDQVGHAGVEQRALRKKAACRARGPDQVGHAGVEQGRTEEEDRQHGDHGRRGEAGERLGGAEKPAQGEAQQAEKSRDFDR